MDLSPLADLAPEVFGMAVLLVFSAFFSGTETSLFSLTRGQRERLLHSARTSEKVAARLLSNPRRLIVTLLVGNELVNIAFSAVSTGVVEELAPHWRHTTVIGVATAVTVTLLLMFGEITPKSIAIRIPEAWARGASRPVALFSVLVTPLRWLVTLIAGVFLRISGSSGGVPGPAAIGEDEFKALVDAGSAEGTLEASERSLIHRVFEFGDRRVDAIMQPLAKVFSLSYELPMARLLVEITRQSYSRVPVYRGRKDEVVGILYAKDLIAIASGASRSLPLKDLLRVPSYVPKTTKCVELFREFKKTKTHMALIVDEYGRMVGLVTMEDLLEELFGEIRDEKEAPRARRLITEPGDVTSPPTSGGVNK